MSASSSSMDPIGGLAVDTAGSVVKVKEAVTAAVGLSPGQVEQTARDGFTLGFTFYKMSIDALRPRRRCLLVARGRGKHRCAARA